VNILRLLLPLASAFPNVRVTLSEERDQRWECVAGLQLVRLLDPAEDVGRKGLLRLPAATLPAGLFPLGNSYLVHRHNSIQIIQALIHDPLDRLAGLDLVLKPEQQSCGIPLVRRRRDQDWNGFPLCQEGCTPGACAKCSHSWSILPLKKFLSQYFCELS
jgi:hypothetical protein